MPLINNLAMCSKIPPTCATMHDCSDHIGGGVKKDASFVPGLLVETDLANLYTDVFFFDDTINVAKVGKMLEAKFLRTYSLHGGEHALSFPLDLSKQPAVRESLTIIFDFHLQSSLYAHLFAEIL